MTEPIEERGPEVMPDEVAVDLTTEIRWFFDGPPPVELLAWFTGSGSGLIEDRCDTYRLDGQVDTGVKRRSRATLELKRRLGPPEPFATVGLAGQLEVWKRWSPAAGLVQLTDSTLWADVDKTVIKRRFDATGQEVALSERSRPMTGDGCDAEIATISVNAERAWTFALAAFGNAERHRHLLVSTWNALAVGRPEVLALGLLSHRSCGYPEWLARFSPAPAA